MESSDHWQYTAVTIAAIINVVITACYALFSYFLWRSTSDSVRLTRQMLEASYSPYVGTQLVEITGISNESVTFQILLKNYGNSPAHNLVTKIEFIADGRVLKAEQIGPSSLPPQSDVVTQTHCSAGGYGRIGSAPRQIALGFTYEGISNTKYHRCEKYEHRYVGGPLVALPCDEGEHNSSRPTQD